MVVDISDSDKLTGYLKGLKGGSFFLEGFGKILEMGGTNPVYRAGDSEVCDEAELVTEYKSLRVSIGAMGDTPILSIYGEDLEDVHLMDIHPQDDGFFFELINEVGMRPSSIERGMEWLRNMDELYEIFGFTREEKTEYPQRREEPGEEE